MHGCLVELEELIAKLKITPRDKVYFVGDLINKGPQSYEVLTLVRAKENFTSIKGNHEHECLKGGEDKIARVFQRSLPEDSLKWLENLKHYIVNENFILVHGGFDPRIALEKNSLETLINVREINGLPWHDYYLGEKMVIYGHWARQGLKVKKNSIGLDSGCVYGGALSAYILEEREVVQVKAKKNYRLV